MIKICSFYIKLLTKNAVFICSILILSVYIYFILESLDQSIQAFTSVFYYGFICFNLFFLVFSAYIVSKQYELFAFLEQDIFKKQSIVLLSCFIISLFISFLPIAIMLIFKNPFMEFPFIWQGIFHFFILWMLSNLFAAALGTSFGILLKSELSILLSLAIYGWFVWEAATQNPNSAFKKFTNIFDDHLKTLSNPVSGNLLDSFYFLDKLFLILVILFLFYIPRSILHKKYKVRYMAVAALTFCFIAGTVFFGEQQIQKIEAVPTKLINDTYKIHSYKMDLSLSNHLENTVEMKLYFTEDGNFIEMLLDKHFDIRFIKIGNEKVTFAHKGHLIKIDYSYKKNETITCVINYKGRVHLENELGATYYYVSKNSVNLPGWVFPWYPSKPNPEDAFFEVHVQSPAKLYSNLGMIYEETGLMKGNATSLNLFAGQYQQVKDQDVLYLIPIHFNFDVFKSQLKDSINSFLKEEDSLPKREQKQLQKMDFKKIIIGSWPVEYRWIHPVGDTLLINHME